MHLLDQFDPAPLSGKYDTLARFDADPRPDRVNLQTGIYLDEHGQCGRVAAIDEATARLASRPADRDYLPVLGHEGYRGLLARMVLGHADAVVAQTPGGTAALHLALRLVVNARPDATLWLPGPTWGNHVRIARDARVAVRHVPWDTQGQTHLDTGPLIASLKEAAPGDVVLLHGACHNPTGIDPSPAQWRELAAACGDRGLLPLLDLAFVGYTAPLEEELRGVRTMVAALPEALIAVSLGKTFGLYNERVGALLATTSPSGMAGLARELERIVRGTWSSPAAHGARLVHAVLSDPTLTADWERHLMRVRTRIRSMRQRWVDGLRAAGSTAPLDHVIRERGLFTNTGLTPDAVHQLGVDHAVHLGPSGYINLCSMTPEQLDRVVRVVAPLL